MLQAHNDEVQSHNWKPDAVQGKSKQIWFHTKTSESWCVRSGWHTVGLERTAAEKSSHSQCLCRLFLFPLGIPANLHLCQLDVADGIGVWKTKTGKGWFISCSDRKRCINMLINLPRKLQSVGDIVMWLQEILFGNVFSATMNVFFSRYNTVQFNLCGLTGPMLANN